MPRPGRRRHDGSRHGRFARWLCGNLRWRRRIVTNAHVAWEARHAAVGKLLVAEGDRGADGGRGAALAIAEAGADGELGAVGQPGPQRSEPALVLAGPFQLAAHHRPRVVKCLALVPGRGTA